MIGTLLNVAAVVVGGTLGTFLGDRLPLRVRETVTYALGLFSLVLGVQMTFKTSNLLIVLGSLIIGGILGESLRLDDGLNWLARQLERLSQRGQPAGEAPAERGRFATGFITASLVFCVGPVAILGSVQDGLSGDYSLLAVKSVLDGFGALAFAATFGLGVTASALIVLIYQGALTLSATWARGLLTEPMVAEMTATGGVLILAIGLMILEIKRVRVASFLPSLALAPLTVAVLSRFQ